MCKEVKEKEETNAGGGKRSLEKGNKKEKRN